MKKVLFVICLVFSLQSCYTEGTEKVQEQQGMGGDVYVKEFVYKNHSYLEFKDNAIKGQGWVHNPECDCFNK